MEIAPRIEADPGRLAGKPCIRHTRIRVVDILQMLAGGATVDEMLEDFPSLEREDISAALSYAATQVAGPVVFAVHQAAE